MAKRTKKDANINGEPIDITPVEVNAELTTKKEALANYIKDINKKAGREVALFGLPDIKYISTGITLLDQLIGGGLMAGRITTLMGSESVGKTSLCATMVGSAQRLDKNSVWLWLDFENSLYNTDDSAKKGEEKKSWLETLGVDTKRLVFVHSLETMEEYCDFCLSILRSKDSLINGVVIDSVGAMLPQGAVYKKQGSNLKEKSMTSDTMGLLARSLNKFLSMVKGLLDKQKAPMLAITHIYQDINNGGYNVPKGGNGFRHFADLRLYLSSGQKVNWPFNEKDGDKPIFIGFEQVITLDKTKNNSSKHKGTQINLPFIYGKGIDEARFLANRAMLDGFIGRGAAYYYFNDDLSNTEPANERQHKIQGSKSFWEFLNTNEGFRNSLFEKYKGVDLFSETYELPNINESEENIEE